MDNLFPKWAYRYRRDWLRDVRKRWKLVRKANREAIHGSTFYPKEVRDWMAQFDKIDEIMKDYYKNA